MPHIKFVNLHFYLNKLREEALINNQIGPKVMIPSLLALFPFQILVTGSSLSGKTTLCKILANYATKTGWKPIYCDLDFANNDIFTKGCIASTVLDSPYPVIFQVNKA